MKKLLRPVAVLLAAFLVGCASPYQAQMQALHHAYMAGNVSDREYRNQMTQLQMADAGWQQQNANTATAAAVIGVAAIGTAALLDNDHRHHHRRYYRPRHRW